MLRIDILEFESNFEVYFDQASDGETIMITRNGHDYVVLLPYTGDNTKFTSDDIPSG